MRYVSLAMSLLTAVHCAAWSADVRAEPTPIQSNARLFAECQAYAQARSDKGSSTANARRASVEAASCYHYLLGSFQTFRLGTANSCKAWPADMTPERFVSDYLQLNRTRRLPESAGRAEVVYSLLKDCYCSPVADRPAWCPTRSLPSAP